MYPKTRGGEDQVLLSIRCDAALHRRIAARACANDRPVSAEIRRALRRYLDAEEKQAA